MCVSVLTCSLSYLLSHACCQQHVDAVLDGCCNLPFASRQVRQQRLPVDPLTGEIQRRSYAVRWSHRGTQNTFKHNMEFCRTATSSCHLSDRDSLWALWCFCWGTRVSFCDILLAAQAATVGGRRRAVVRQTIIILVYFVLVWISLGWSSLNNLLL